MSIGIMLTSYHQVLHWFLQRTTMLTLQLQGCCYYSRLISLTLVYIKQITTKADQHADSILRCIVSGNVR